MVTKKAINQMVKEHRTDDVILAHQINEKEKEENHYGIFTLTKKLPLYTKRVYAQEQVIKWLKMGKKKVFGLDEDCTRWFINELFHENVAKDLIEKYNLGIE